MYLKQMELVGFKSFADRTKLEFGQGITAIVGPNGCGKSNVSDAVRWVLGEQSARLLRGSKMEDCIFNGTDKRKAIGMAEASITLDQCEDALGTEFNQITITRRVFRSGEGQYFINKTPCRLKDIQRLFMGTGIGTNSYSLMEQGKIDQILSSKPEDRRAVFEEASGITKYKSDKKEAVRKLEHTETNLQRLADIIKEVKRQIISLQRQAGKAKRYQKLRDDLRKLDIFSSKRQLNDFDAELNSLSKNIAEFDETVANTQSGIEASEKAAVSLRDELSERSTDISTILQRDTELKGTLERLLESVKSNRERIRELELLLARDSEDVRRSRDELETCKTDLRQNTAYLEHAGAELTGAERELATANETMSRIEDCTEKLGKAVSELQNESVEGESKLAKLRNELNVIEHEERTAVVFRERLETEKTNLEHTCEANRERIEQAKNMLADCSKNTESAEHELTTVEEYLSGILLKKGELNDELANIERLIAGRNAKIELLTQNADAGSGFPAGAGKILDAENPLGTDKSTVLGALADMIEAEPDYRVALETVLRAWFDAVVVTGFPHAFDILKKVKAAGAGAVRIVSVDNPSSPAPANTPEHGPGLLIDHLSCDDAIRPMIARLLSNVFVVDSVKSLPATPDSTACYVSKDGVMLNSNGALELWAPDSSESNPLARKHLLSGLAEEIEDFEKNAQSLKTRMAEASDEILKAQDETKKHKQRVDETRRIAATRQGEFQIISRESDQARDRLDTVLWELKNLDKQGDSTETKSRIAADIEAITERRNEIRAEIGGKTEEIRNLERERKEAMADVMARQAVFTEKRQKAEHLKSQCEPLKTRITGLESFIESRTGSFEEYRSDIEKRKQAILEAERKTPETQHEIERNSEQLLVAEAAKEEAAGKLEAAETNLKTQRVNIDQVRDQRSRAAERRAELRMQKQNLVERVTGEYKIGADSIQLEPDPEWEDGEQPDPETLETLVAELRAKLESLGPVNLVAIEEYKEHEERHAFLNRQYEDLIRSRQQLHEMIRKINQTTSEMFSETFTKINDNFQSMFKRLFAGGNAKLMMIDDEDPLECGIEIIAKPPGKSLKSVSLLSGGERTLTAVALLFAIYMVKPSPFCVLDELDAALDESNIKRFVGILQEFMVQSQFIIITHSKQTISVADILYGVTMEERGVSNVVSMRFAEKEDTGKPGETVPEPVGLSEKPE